MQSSSNARRPCVAAARRAGPTQRGLPGLSSHVGLLKDVASPRAPSPSPCQSDHDPGALADIQAIHSYCGVYTRDDVVQTILDSIGWTAHAQLNAATLLEPAAGDGAFVVEAADRLLKSFARKRLLLSVAALKDRIRAFEIHPVEAEKARERLMTVLKAVGIRSSDARYITQQWVQNADFLLADLSDNAFSHVAGNPPYARWPRIPQAMRKRYDLKLPRRMVGGDLFLPFLDLSIGYLRPGGRIGFVCSDRWRYMAFAEQFRAFRLPQVVVEREEAIASDLAYYRKVDAYASIIVLRKSGRSSTHLTPLSTDPRRMSDEYQIRVGPALGCSHAFVVQPNEANEVEEELLAPWLDGTEVLENQIRSRGLRVVVMHNQDGSLRNLDDYPIARRRFEKYRSALERRSIVKAGAAWYKPIDRVIAADWSRPKLLVPEIARVPRIAMDLTGAIPSHGVYAIFAPDDDLTRLHNQLKDGGLANALDGIAPRIKGGYFRCYKRFLGRIVINQYSGT
jgi:adenine-specific DNA-methyltransferase